MASPDIPTPSEPSSALGVFSVEVYLRLKCPHCQQGLKRRFLDYLTSRTSSCPNCQAKLVHLARGQTSHKEQIDMKEIQRVVESLESSWGGLVNELLTLESKDWSQGGPGLA